jgi:argininosuccinate synthase
LTSSDASESIATMEANPTETYNQDETNGSIRLNALRLKVAAKEHGKKE